MIDVYELAKRLALLRETIDMIDARNGPLDPADRATIAAQHRIATEAYKKTFAEYLETVDHMTAEELYVLTFNPPPQSPSPDQEK